MSSDFTPEQKRYLEGFTSGLQIARLGRGAAAAPAKPSGPDAEHIAAQDRVLAAGKTHRTGEVQARAASVRRLSAPAGAGGEERVSQARRQFPLALLRPVLRRAGAELLHVPAAHPERHPQALAAVGPRRSRRALRRRLFARHHAREFPDPRDRAEERDRPAGSDLGSGPVLARHRRRQHPQRHRHADRRHRPAGTDRHAALCAGMAPPHPQRARAVRPAAQVQRRVRRRRPASRCWRTPTTSASRPSR